MKKLSIIIVCYNSSHDLEGAISSILKYNDLEDDTEIIVVDNNSNINEQHIQKKISEKFQPYLDIKYFLNKDNKGYGAGNNFGVAQSNGEIILIMNPDVRLYMPIFNKIVSNFISIKDLGILGISQYESSSLNKKNRSFITNLPAIKHQLLFYICKRFDIFMARYFCFSGACFAVRKKAFIDAGEFNSEIFLYWEESDLQYRVGKHTSFTKVKYDNSLGYIHPYEGRSFSDQQFNIGLNSYFKMMNSRKENLSKSKKRIINYYKFIDLFNFLINKNKKSFYTQKLFKYLENDLSI